MSDENSNENLSVDIPRVFSQHLVSVSCWDHTPAVLEHNSGHPHLHTFSAFVVSINGASWSLMTAGHAIRDTEELVRKGHDLRGWHIDDSPVGMPPEGVPVPLEWEPEYIATLHDESRGADFALIPLNSLQQASLASNGVLPITEAQVEMPSGFVRWYVLGLPAATAKADFRRQVVHKHFLGLPVEPLRERPHDWPTVGQKDMLYGQLIPVGVPEIDSIEIPGMSGGPIIGLRLDASGQAEWKVIGIQSGWLRSRRIISVCMAWPIFDAIGRLIDDERNGVDGTAADDMSPS
ncbi:hypothetical protein [Burkholderia pyrrocinia]|uniref:hypothetical protein n=1 Tax=Burkholderia pyrrocinia TaxID=60550 RepID=UPI0010529D80|nr:hypothetical protein [Burkholderia pyrrocinia]TDA48090.1 hypothetical protein EVG18_07325 [Burkholderia pyrrocinia]